MIKLGIFFMAFLSLIRWLYVDLQVLRSQKRPDLAGLARRNHLAGEVAGGDKEDRQEVIQLPLSPHFFSGLSLK